MASLLETFFILFDSNDDKIKKSVPGTKQKVDDLDKSLTHTDRAAKAMGESILTTFRSIAGAAVGAFAVRDVYEAITAQAELNEQLGLTATRLNVNIEDLDAWGKASQRFGGSEQGFQQTLDFLNRGMADIATKGTSRLKPFFDELKIKTTDAPKHVRPLFDILGDLADRLSKMDKQQAAGIGEKLGIDTGTLIMLQSGRRNLEDLIKRQKELGVTTEQDAEEAHKYEEAIADLNAMLHHLYTEIGSSVLPALTSFFGWLERGWNYLMQHKGLVEGFFIGVAGVITAVYLPAVIEAIVATVAWLAPFILIGGAIAAVGIALGLLVDDVQNFLAGHKSVIGELSKKWPIVGETVRAVVRDVQAALQWLLDFAKGWVQGLGASFHLVGALASAGAAIIVSVFKSVSGTLADFSRGFTKAFPLWAEGFKMVGGVIGWFVGLIEKMIGLLASAAGWFGKFAASALAHLPDALKNYAGRTNALADNIEGKPETQEAYQQRLADLNKARVTSGQKPVKTIPGEPAPPVQVAAQQPPAQPPPAIRPRPKPGEPAPRTRLAEDRRTPPAIRPAVRAAAATTPPSAPQDRPQPAPVGDRPRRRADAQPRPVVAVPPSVPERIERVTRAVIQRDTVVPAVLPSATVVAHTVRLAQAAIHTADTSPLSSRQSVMPQQVTKNYQVSVTGPITIETQASDAQGIAGDFTGELTRQMRQALDHFDDGVKA